MNETSPNIADISAVHEQTKKMHNKHIAWHDILNSPFVITLIGGLLLGGFSAYLQYAIANAQRREAERAEHAARRVQLVYDFADKFPQTLSLADRWRQRQLWLDTNTAASTGRFTDGRTFEETRKLCDELFERYITQKPTASLCNQIITEFSPNYATEPNEAFACVQRINANIDGLLNASNQEQRLGFFAGANTTYQELTVILFEQINNPVNHR